MGSGVLNRSGIKEPWILGISKPSRNQSTVLMKEPEVNVENHG
jgi:hypothetical protein